MTEPYIDIDDLMKEMDDFIIKNKNTLENISNKVSNIFQSYCYILVAKYFKALRFNIELINKESKKFRLKIGPRGNPNNFSYFLIKSKKKKIIEIRCNLPVFGYSEEKDAPTLSLDIALIKPNTVPNRKHPIDGYSVQNKNLISFFSVKHRYGSPDLIASFSGIIIIMMPKFLDPSENRTTLLPFYNKLIPLPALLLSGNIGTNGKKVVERYKKMNYKISVIGNVPKKRTIIDN